MKPNARYEYLLWDVDGTLLDFEYSMRVSLYKSLKNIGVEATDELIDRYSQINDGWWKRLERGEVTKAQLLPGRFADLFAEFEIECNDLAAYLADFQENLGCEYQLMENALDVCKRLKAKGYHQFVVTNGVTRTQENKLKLSGLADTMEELFISEQLGAPKPNKEFFDACFERISERYPDFDKSKAIIIGDSLSSDIQGGINAEIDTCFYSPVKGDTGGLKVTYRISKLEEIFEVV